MYVLKHIPEDFQVKEVPDILCDEQGQYTYYVLKKKNYNTLTALEHIANKLRIPLKAISAAGNKDKKAVTEQLISIKRGRNQPIDMKDLSLTVYGKGNRPISRGILKGNQFTIVVRNVEHPLKKKTTFLNLFGEQRFSKNNVDIGRAIIKQEWEKACELLHLPTHNPVNTLQQEPTSYIKLFVHAFQSYLWNETVKQLGEKEKATVPLIGFSTEADEDVEPIIEALLEKEGLTQRSFIIRQIPDLSLEGTERAMKAEAQDLSIKMEDDDLFPGKQKALLSFFLPKGCYATVFIDQLVQQAYPA